LNFPRQLVRLAVLFLRLIFNQIKLNLSNEG
jgi:hypothetical protein